MTNRTLRTLGLAAIAAVAAAALAASPASAGQYGRFLDSSSASGTWTDTPGAAANGTVRNPKSFTVVVTGNPQPSYFCTDDSACREITVAWSVACKKNGGYKLKRSQVISTSTRIVANAKLPMRNPQRCSISASGQLAYYAGGSVSVAIYFRR